MSAPDRSGVVDCPAVGRSAGSPVPVLVRSLCWGSRWCFWGVSQVSVLVVVDLVMIDYY